MKCPLYFTCTGMGIDYDEVVALHDAIMERIEYFIDNEYTRKTDEHGRAFPHTPKTIVFENENYIVNDGLTGVVVKRRKRLTAFTEPIVSSTLAKYGYEWKIIHAGDPTCAPPPPDKLCFQVDMNWLFYKMYYPDKVVDLRCEEVCTHSVLRRMCTGCRAPREEDPRRNRTTTTPSFRFVDPALSGLRTTTTPSLSGNEKKGVFEC